MKKILIFGDSFTIGSYTKSNKYIPYSDGWYHYVDYFNDKDVNVVGTSGGGIWLWYQIIMMLHKTNRLNYDEIWIQESWEPRISALNQITMHDISKYWDGYFDATYQHMNFRKKLKDINVFCIHSIQNEEFELWGAGTEVINVIYEKFNKTIWHHSKKNKPKVYVIPFSRSPHCRYKNVVNKKDNVVIFDELKTLFNDLSEYIFDDTGRSGDDKKFTTGHQTLKGTKMMGRKINAAFNNKIKEMVNSS